MDGFGLGDGDGDGEGEGDGERDGEGEGEGAGHASRNVSGLVEATLDTHVPAQHNSRPVHIIGVEAPTGTQETLTHDMLAGTQCCSQH